MLKAAWLRYRNGAAFASLKKIAFGFFQSRLWCDRTERGAFAITGGNQSFKLFLL